MTASRAELLLGADYEGDESFCHTVVNSIKNHFRVSNPCVAMTERQPGEILSDPDDDKLYHVGGESGYPCDEILQETRSCDVIPEFKGVDYYDACNGDYATIRGIDEPGLGHRLTIGLDETTRTMIVCDLGDIAVDFGLVAQNAVSLIMFNADFSRYKRYRFDQIYSSHEMQFYSGEMEDHSIIVDIASGPMYRFRSGANIELTDNNAEQAFMYLEPKINQTSTAGYIGLLMDVTETSLGDASAGAGYNALLDLRIATVSYFAVQNNGMHRMSDGTDVHYFGSYQEPGLGGRLTIGLDETANTLVVCQAGDIYNDFALAVQGTPTLYMLRDTGTTHLRLQWSNIFSLSNFEYKHMGTMTFRRKTVDLTSGNQFTFDSDLGVEMTDNNAEQAWMYIEPKVRQTSTAGYIALLIDVTEITLGDGSAGAGYNALLDLRVAGTTQFGIQNGGQIMTNQVEAGAIGAYDRRIPIYDETGSLEGYVALYAAP